MSEPLPGPAEGWRRVDGVPASFMETLHVAGDTLYVGGQGRVYRTLGDGRWRALPAIPGGYEVATLTTAAGRLVAGTYQGGVFEADADETAWRARSEGLSGTGVRTDGLWARPVDELLD